MQRSPSSRARLPKRHFDDLQPHTPVRNWRGRTVKQQRRTCGVKVTPNAAPCTGVPTADGGVCHRHTTKKLEGVPVNFPDTPSIDQLQFIARAWKDNFANARWTQLTCAICSGIHNADEIKLVAVRAIAPDWLDPVRAPVDFLPHLEAVDTDHRAALFHYGDPALDGAMLDRQGLVLDLGGHPVELRACSTCFTSLEGGHCPSVSLFNGLWTGPVPPELEALTPAEEIVIGLSRSTHTALFFLKTPTPDADLDSRQRASKGHWLSWPQLTDRAYEAVSRVPRPVGELGDVLHVTLVGAGQHDEAVLKSALSVSIRRVKAAFDWLKVHNELYSRVVWDSAAAASYGSSDEVPASVERFRWAGDDLDVGDRDTYETETRPQSKRTTPDRLDETSQASSGGTPTATSDGCSTSIASTAATTPAPTPEEHCASSNDPSSFAEEQARLDKFFDMLEEARLVEESGVESLDAFLGNDDDVDGDDGEGSLGAPIEVTTSGMIDVGGQRAPVREGRTAALDKTLRTPHVTVGRTNGLESSYDCELFPRVFPKLFPYGVGGVSGGKSVGVPSSASGAAPDLLKHIRGLLLSGCRRFAKHQTFMFFAFDLHQRREVARRTAIKVGQSAHRAADLATITVDDLVALRSAVFEGGAKGRRTSSVARAELLLKHCQWVMGSVVGSKHSRLYSRNHLRALVTAFGSPSVWFTISPADQQSVLLLKLNRYDVDLERDGQVQLLPDLAERRKAIADDPVAVALFFRAVMDAVLEILFGATRDASKQGVFGRALSHYATIENGRRGYLHAHGLLWLHGQPSPEAFRAALEDPSFQARVCEYVDRVMAQDFDGARDFVAEARHEGVVLDRTATLSDLPPDPSKPVDEWWEAMNHDRRTVGERTLVHLCHPKCKKNGDCRYRYPKEIVPNTFVNEDKVVIPQRRHPRVNGHNPLMANLTRCNSDVKLTFLAPALLLSFIFYATKYMTKSDLAVNRTIALMQIATETYEQYKDEISDQAERAKALLRRCRSRISADADLPAPAVAYYILYGEDHFASDVFAPLQLGVALARIGRLEQEATFDNDNNVSMDGEERAAITVNADGEVIEHNQVEDYVNRHPDLEDVPFYLFAAKYEVKPRRAVKTSANSNRQFDFVAGHPRAKTHSIHERETPVVPVIQGPSVPRQDHPSESVRIRFSRSTLALFKPWRALDDLRQVDQTWEEAFAAFEPSAEVEPFMANLQLLHSMKDAGDQMRKAHGSLGKRKGLERDGRNARGSVEPEPLDNAASYVDPDAAAAGLMGQPLDGDTWVKGALEILEAHGVTRPALDQSLAEANGLAGVGVWSSNRKRRLDDWKAVLSEQDGAITARRRAYNVATSVDSVPSTGNASNGAGEGDAGQEVPDHIVDQVDLRPAALTEDALDPAHETNPVAFARAKGLNKKQSAAFVLIANAQLDAEQKKDCTPPQIFVAGAAGSGKSVVLNTIAAWMESRRRTGQLRLVASTGTAAAKIKGMTLHSLLGFRRPKNADSGEVDALSENKGTFEINDRVRAEIEHVTLVCCDEVGMVGHRLMNNANAVFQKVKGTAAAFGGIVTVWFGDFCQFAPVGDSALFDNPPPPKSGPPLANLWRDEITHCIVLDEPMRQRADEAAFLKTLANLRVGTKTKESWHLLNKRVANLVDHRVHLGSSRFEGALFITPRHTLRREVNRLRVSALARSRQQPWFASIPFYWTSGKRRTTIDFRALASASPRKHGNCDAVVYLTIGMPVVLNTNHHTGQGITNGAYGTVTQIILDDVDAESRRSNDYANVIVLQRPPKMVIVKLRDVHPDLARLDGLEEGEVPIAPIQGRTDLADTKVNFSQLPLSPAFAVTDYRAQGATESAVVVDLVPPSQSKTPAEIDASPTKSVRAASYVSISRVTTIDGLAVLRPFRAHHLGTGVEPSLFRQLARETRMERTTLAELDRTLVERGWRAALEDYIVVEKGYEDVL